MLLSCLWILTACNSEDLSYDIEYTPIHPLGGQYTAVSYTHLTLPTKLEV